MSRYLVFGGDEFYPKGGWHDYHSAHDALEEAVAVADAQKPDWDYPTLDWAHVIDATTGQIVHRQGQGYDQPGYFD